MKLKHIESSNYRLIWSSATDIAHGKSGDLKLDVSGFTERFRGGKDAFIQKLIDLPDSYKNQYRYTCKGLVLIESIKRRVCNASTAGMNSRNSIENLGNLSKEEYEVLLGLAVHHRGWELQNVPDGIQLDEEGWVRLTPSLVPSVHGSLIKLNQKNSNIIQKDGNDSFRLSVDPKVVYFDPINYHLLPIEKSLEIKIKRLAMDTALGTCPEIYLSIAITHLPRSILKQLIENKPIAHSDAPRKWWERECGAELTGLWNLVGQDKLAIHFAENESS